MKHFSVFAILAVILLHASAETSGAQSALQAQSKMPTVCDFPANSKSFQGEKITITGQVEGNFLGAYLTSAGCDQSLPIILSDRLNDSPSVTDLQFQIDVSKKLVCNDLRPFVVTLRGTLVPSTTKKGAKRLSFVVDEVVSSAFTCGMSKFCERISIYRADIAPQFCIEPTMPPEILLKSDPIPLHCEIRGPIQPPEK